MLPMPHLEDRLCGGCSFAQQQLDESNGLWCTDGLGSSILEYLPE
jgi:hypothetical protein